MIRCLSTKKIGEVTMINFIIYEDNKKWQQEYKNSILKIIGQNNIKYNILTIEKYNKTIKDTINNLLGKKIYLLDLEVPGKTGLDFAREVRNHGDWQSPIIIITSHESFKNEGYASKILMLDFIVKTENTNEFLNDSLNIALEINNTYDSFNFTFNNEYYQIPYDDIFYFEKNLNDNYTTIVTKTRPYKIKESITKLSTKFTELHFFYKTHQSCIVNLNNIEKVDFTNNLIYFHNCKINLLSRDKKKSFKELLTKEHAYDNNQINS